MKAALGVDIGGTSIKLALVSESGEILDQTSVLTYGDKDPDVTVGQITDYFREVKTKFPSIRVVGTGIGVPGTVALDGGTVSFPPNLKGWGIVRLGDMVAEATGLPAFVENDANVAALGEGIYGAGMDVPSFVMVTLGTGVGGGIVIDKKIYRGVFGAAGEIGHISIDHNGPTCNCSNKGCLERYIGQRYIIDYAMEIKDKYHSSPVHDILAERALEVKDLAQLAVRGDELGITVLNRTGHLLGVGLTSIMHILDIRTFIIGGGVAGAGDHIFRPAEHYVKSHALAPMRSAFKMIPASLGNQAGVLGAAALVFKS